MNAVTDLTDAEIHEIDELLGLVPEPYETLDAVILDGYLCGVLVQPVLLTPEQWLPPIFGTEGIPEPGEKWTEKQNKRLLTLIQRRYDELLRGILEKGWFDPLVPLVEDEDGNELKGKEAWKAWASGWPASNGPWPTSPSWKKPA